MRRPGAWETAFGISGFQVELVHEFALIPEGTQQLLYSRALFHHKCAGLIVFSVYSPDS